MTQSGWPFSGFFTTRPRRDDLFVLTLIDGEIVGVDSILEYDSAVMRGHALHRHRDCKVKVLPVKGEVVRSLFGIRPTKRPEPIDPAVWRSFVRRLTRIASSSTDRTARIEASEVLRQMGVLRS